MDTYSVSMFPCACTLGVYAIMICPLPLCSLCTYVYVCPHVSQSVYVYYIYVCVFYMNN